MFIPIDLLAEAYRRLGFRVERRDREQVTFRHPVDGRMTFYATRIKEGVDANLVLEDASLALGDEFAGELKEAIRSVLL